MNVYENQNYVPMGFVYDTFTDVFDQALTPETTAEVMLKAVVLRGSQVGGVSGMTPKRLLEQPERTWQEAAAELRENACDSFEGTPAGFTAHIDAKRDGASFASRCRLTKDGARRSMENLWTCSA